MLCSAEEIDLDGGKAIELFASSGSVLHPVGKASE